jgi:hypothetical protein
LERRLEDKAVVAERPDAVSATSRAAVTSFGSSTEWYGDDLPDTGASTAVTAEIPAVPAAPAYGVLLPDGSIWYPGSKHKYPAPSFLRVTVWLLALFVMIGASVLVMGHFQPSWIDPLRLVASGPGQSGGGGTASTTVPASAHSSNKMQITSQTATSLTYSVPGRTYVLVITTTQRCYVVVKSLATGTDLINSTLSAGATQTVSVSSGSATVEAYAGGSSLSVRVAHAQVGNISSLGYAITYKFDPTNS